MLIIPVEKAIDWRKPPMATLCLIVLNIVLYVAFLNSDTKLYERAWETYTDADLQSIEIPAYEAYLDRKISLQGDDRQSLLLEVKRSIDEGQTDWIIDYVLTDTEFVHYLEKDGAYFWSTETFNRWREIRKTIDERYISELSYIDYGLLPADVNLSDLLSYQFMHGSWAHLIGNMIFLFLVGYTVEKALGAGRYLIAYLLCGMCSGLFYTLITGDSLQPLVGASGSISGLMGMYVAIFGLQKIRFFYFFAIYFGYFTAPALAVLPVWVMKELFDYSMSQSSGIAFMAHVGGLLAGAALVMMFGKSWLQVKEEFHEATDDEKDEAFREEYDHALKALSRLEFDMAKERFKVMHRKYPEDSVILLHYYHLEKLNPASSSYADVLVKVIEDCVRLSDYPKLMKIYREAEALSSEQSLLAEDVHTRVLYSCIRENEMKDAELVFSHLKRGENTDMIREACLLLIDNFKRHQQAMKVNQYQAALKAMDSPS